MSILVNKDSKVIVQGITGSEGQFHSVQMLEYGTNIGITNNLRFARAQLLIEKLKKRSFST